MQYLVPALSIFGSQCVCTSLLLIVHECADLTVYLDCAMGVGVTSIADAVVGSISFIDLSAHLC